MYKLLTLICVCALFLRTAYSATALRGPQTPPEKYAGQPGCYEPTADIMIPVGVPFSPADGKSCIQYTCGSNGMTQIFTCGSLSVPPGTELKEDLFKKYPDCCPQIVKK